MPNQIITKALPFLDCNPVEKRCSIELLFDNKGKFMDAILCNKILTLRQTPYAEEMIAILDLARAGHLPSICLLQSFFNNLEQILQPFGSGLFDAAECFTESLQE